MYLSSTRTAELWPDTRKGALRAVAIAAVCLALAATLLYLNNRVTWVNGVPHNNLATNALLVVILALFAIVGGDEAVRAVRPFLR